jgi:hypothetical protein
MPGIKFGFIMGVKISIPAGTKIITRNIIANIR